MWTSGSDIFLQRPRESAARILHPATVVGGVDRRLSVRFDKTDLALSPGQDVLMYYDIGQRFHKHPAKVAEVELDGTQWVATVELDGEAVSADSRQCYRTVTVTTNLTVKVGEEPACALLDASMTGLAVASREVHSIGTLVEVELTYDGQTYQGMACVQSVCDLGAGKVRYGFHAAGARGPQDNLLKGLKQVTMCVQRVQLQRRAGIR